MGFAQMLRSCPPVCTRESLSPTYFLVRPQLLTRGEPLPVGRVIPAAAL
jgi:hypothetical protein